MKLVVLAVVALVAVALAAPVDQVVSILRSDSDVQPDGAYSYAVETSDGTKKEEAGEIKVVNDEENKPQPVVAVRGQYSYVDPEGNPHSITYYADETGFHPEGADIPKQA